MMDMGSSVGLLPNWLRLIWVVAFAGIAAVHIGHARAMEGQRRCWHAIHVLMALGMIEMFLPLGKKGVPGSAWEVALGAAAAGVVVWMVEGSQPVSGLWAVSVVDLVAMVYMFALSSAASAALSYALAGYFVLESVAWAIPVLGDTGRWQGTLALPSSGATAPVVAAPVTLSGRASLGLRASLAVMAMGMAYMFVAVLAGH